MLNCGPGGGGRGGALSTSQYPTQPDSTILLITAYQSIWSQNGSKRPDLIGQSQDCSTKQHISLVSKLSSIQHARIIQLYALQLFYVFQCFSSYQVTKWFKMTGFHSTIKGWQHKVAHISSQHAMQHLACQNQ